MARIAMFLARSPGPPMNGRKAVINTAIAALAQEGHDVDLFILAEPGPLPECAGDACWLGTVPKARMACNAALSLLGASGSLNEALFRSRRFLRVARGLGRSYDFAFADTIRTAPYADATGLPWHLDLDDLLSKRYEKYVAQADQLSAALVLGYYRASAPRAASIVPRVILRRLLRSETVRLRRREVYWARRATTVSLVSPDEAEGLAHAASREVHSVPMSVAIPARRWMPRKAGGAAPAFLGGLDYKPNLDALLYYQHKIFPLVEAAGGAAPRLAHIGKSPPELRRKFLPEVVDFEGYVTDVVSRLSAAAFFVAPMVSGTGIKTKVLEAMAIGLPVIATRHAVAGLNVEHRKHCLICERPADFAEGMRYLSRPDAAERMGLAGRNYVQANFSIEVLRRRWSELVRQLALDAGMKC